MNNSVCRIKGETVRVTIPTHLNLVDFRVIDTHPTMWSNMASQLLSEKETALTLDDLTVLTSDMNDLYTLLHEGYITFNAPTPSDDTDAPTESEETNMNAFTPTTLNTTDAPEATQEETTMDTINITRLSANQRAILDNLDAKPSGVPHTSTYAYLPATALAAHGELSAVVKEQANPKVKRVVTQLIDKLARVCGLETREVVQRKRAKRNVVPAGAIKIRSTKNQQMILSYIENKFLASLIVIKGATYTILDATRRDACLVLLGELHRHKLSTRSCSSLIKRLEATVMEFDQVAAPVTTPSDYDDAPASDYEIKALDICDAPAEPAVPVYDFERAFDIRKEEEAKLQEKIQAIAPAPEALEPEVEVEEDPEVEGEEPTTAEQAELYPDEQAQADAYDRMMEAPQPLGNVYVERDVKRPNPFLAGVAKSDRDPLDVIMTTPAENTFVEVEVDEAYEDLRQDYEFECAALLQDVKVHTRMKQSPVHLATTLDELRAAQRSIGIPETRNPVVKGFDAPAPKIVPLVTATKTVEVPEVELDTVASADEASDEEVVIDRDEVVSVPFTTAVWSEVLGHVNKLLLDVGFEIEYDMITMPRRWFKSIEPKLSYIAIHKLHNTLDDVVEYNGQQMTVEDVTDQELDYIRSVCA